MKDLTHYFVDAVKSSENAVETASEVMEELSNANGTNDVDQTAKKRGRVKIKISTSDSRGKICKIINSNDDLIDKTPSPLPTSSRIKKRSVDDSKMTPKESNLSKETNKNGIGSDFKVPVGELIEILDSSTENIFSPMKKNKFQQAPLDNETDNKVIREKEESNAFQVLMTRDKPSKVKILAKQLTPEETAEEAKNQEKVKNKLKKNKEKLTSLADKKGYAKRKLIEKEEEEKIEEQLENRAKIFKRKSNDNIQNGVVPQRQRILAPGGLHNYFSKIVSEDQDKIQNGSSQHESQKIENEAEVAEEKNEKSRDRKVLASIDDDQVLKSIKDKSESFFDSDKKRDKECVKTTSKKPRWSLRINLQPTDYAENSTDDAESNGGKSVLQNSTSSSNNNNHNNIDNIDNNQLKRNNKKMKSKLKKKSSEKKVLKVIDDKVEELKRSNSSESTSFVKDADEDIEIVEPKILKRPPNEKLAPLFVKRLKPDPEVLAARRSFLHSRSPEKDGKKLEKINMVPKSMTLPFPKVSHVTQIEINQDNNFQVDELKHSMKESVIYVPKFNVSELKSVTSLSEDAQRTLNEQKSFAQLDPKEVLKEVEEHCSDAREMWKKISSVTSKNDRVTPKKRGRKKKSIEKPVQISAIDQNQYDTWTQKYRPLNTKEIVGNEDAALKLREWLSSWRPQTNKDDYSSSEEFYVSDNSRSSVYEGNQQVAILLGPHGSGKTASVYAIAEELGYNVLEVNASSKRPGRKILKDLEEATKSHRVKNSDVKSSLQLAMKDDAKKIQQNSLILFEDVDLIFDEDDGFISAAYQLASNTKRPIVMTCKDSCTHLSRMAPQQLRIQFQATQGPRASALLDLITLAEAGTRLPRHYSDKLLLNGDLRKAILQLQYLLASRTQLRASLLPTDFRKTLWQDVRSYMYKSTVKSSKKRSKRDKSVSSSTEEMKTSEQSNQLEKNLQVLDNLANDLDTVSVISTLVDVDERILDVSQLKFEPSLSLEENVHYYSSSETRRTDIGEWLRHKTMFKYTSSLDEVDSKVLKQLSLKKELNTGVDLALSQVSMHTLDSRAMSIDYLPAARTICRAEEIKSTNNVKRGNRFFHYFHNLRLPAGALKPSILAAACNAMQEKS